MRCLLAVVLVAALGTPAFAQPLFNPNQLSPFSRPTVSPYLNLVRPIAAPYQLGVLPEFNLRAASMLSEFNYRFNLTPPVLGTEDPYLFSGQLSDTGHPTAFLHYNGYYYLPNTRTFNPLSPGQRQPGRR